MLNVKVKDSKRRKELKKYGLFECCQEKVSSL